MVTPLKTFMGFLVHLNVQLIFYNLSYKKVEPCKLFCRCFTINVAINEGGKRWNLSRRHAGHAGGRSIAEGAIIENTGRLQSGFATCGREYAEV